jgi:hypothetical protein
MSDKMVEEMARALCALNFAKKGCEGDYGNVDDCWFAFVDEAQAAATIAERRMEEMREALEARTSKTVRADIGRCEVVLRFESLADAHRFDEALHAIEARAALRPSGGV